MQLRVLLSMVKLEHALFSLPFAYLGAILGTKGMPTNHHLFWLSVAMLGAHSAGMAFNRLVDHQFDALNPRTQDRALPQGRVSRRAVYWFLVFNLGIFVTAAGFLNRLCLILSPVAILALLLYSYTKRFTYLCHFWLGFVLALAPVGGWLGVIGTLQLPPILLGLAICLWVAGFDIIYQSADVAFDARIGLFSIPRCFGICPSKRLVLCLHVLAVILFLLVGVTAQLGVWYYLGLLLVLGIFIIEAKMILKETRGSFLPAFDLNLVVSLVLLAFTIVDLYMAA